MPSTTIPCLPCVSLEETFAFYEILGFEITYRQKSPNPYGVVHRGDFDLHFFGLKGLVPEHGYSTCLVIVPDVESLHAEFATALKTNLGKLPIRGFPHITRMRPGQSRFTVVDPSGNSVIYIRQSVKEQPEETNLPPLLRALQTANTLRDSKNDDRAAAKVLDVALARHPDAAPLDRARALAARTELAVALSDDASALDEEFAKISLSAEDLAKYRDEFEAANRLRAELNEGR